MIFKILKILITLALLAGTVVMLGFMRSAHSRSHITDVSVNIDYPNNDILISKEDILKLLEQTSAGLRNKPLNQIHVNHLYRAVSENAYVGKCNVELLLNGVLRVRARQLVPMLRIIAADFSCYLDTAGYLMPLSSQFKARVPVFMGEVNIPLEIQGRIGRGEKVHFSRGDEIHWMTDAYKLANYIYNHPTLRPLIEQIVLNADNEFELITKFGSHIVLLGDLERMQQKFENLITFYEQAIPQYGWSAFGQVNLKYHNQVVCLKN